MIGRDSRLIWRCRRGTRELDLVLQAYLERAYDEASPTERAAFVALLERPDCELQSLLFGAAASPDALVSPVLDRLREVAARQA